MTPAERTAKIAELRAEADRLEREGKILEKAVNGALFRSYGRIVLIPPGHPNTYALALTGEAIGCQCYGWAEDPNLEYLGHARDLLTIKTPDAPDAPEPTGEELVGKVCEFSDDGVNWVGREPCTIFDPADREMAYRATSWHGRAGSRQIWFGYARLAKEQP